MEKRKNHKKLFAIAAVVLLLFSLFLTTGYGAGKTAFADSDNYSDVMEDLRKDESFDEAKYKKDVSDTSLQVIQIAESGDGELFIYLYQPSAEAYSFDIRSIRMSLSYEGGTWYDYKLTFLNSSGVFSKYKVDDFKVSDKSTRFYNIVCVSRKYIGIIDSGNLLGMALSVVPCPVEQCWTVTTLNGNVIYSMEKANVVKITGYTFGTIRFKDGQDWINSYAVDGHYIAFSTDWDIEQLLEADVSYDTAVKKKGVWSSSIEEPQHEFKTVSYDDYGGTTGAYTFNSEKRTWRRIQTPDQFVESCGELISDDIKNEVKKQQWVLRYVDTAYEDYTGGVFGWINSIGSFFGANNTSSCTIVSNVSILRLKFISQGEVYNLGVVMGKTGESPIVGDDSSGFWSDAWDSVTGWFGGIFDGVADWFSGVSWWVWLIVAIGVIAIGLPILCYFVPAVRKVVLAVLKAIWNGIKWLVQKLWWLICLPFKGIASLIKKRKGKKDE